MTLKNNLVHWIFPSAVILAMIGMYFRGGETGIWLLVPPGNRELGLLESLQHLLLFIMAGMGLWAAFRATWLQARLLYAGMAAAAAFIFMEEVNYGVQYWMLITGQQPEAVAHIDNLNYVNLHNREGLSDLFKDVGDITLVLLFAIIPLATARSQNKWIQFFRPSRWFIATLLCAYLSSRLAHYLDDHFPPQIDIYDAAAVGEFRELFTYYVWIVYYQIILFKRGWPGDA